MSLFSLVKVMNLRFPIWKPAPGNDGPSCIRIQGSNPNLVGRMQFAYLLLNAASHVIPSVCQTVLFHSSLNILPFYLLTRYINSISMVWMHVNFIKSFPNLLDKRLYMRDLLLKWKTEYSWCLAYKKPLYKKLRHSISEKTVDETMG